MILPSKNLPQEYALLTIGGRILQHIQEPMTISALRERLRTPEEGTDSRRAFHYDKFVLALDLLFMIGAVSLKDGCLTRSKR